MAIFFRLDFLTLYDGHELARHHPEVPPPAVEDLQEGGRNAEQGHDDAGDGQVGDVHVARVAVLPATYNIRRVRDAETTKWESNVSLSLKKIYRKAKCL